MQSSPKGIVGEAARPDSDVIIPLKVVVVYGDVPAGKHAVGVLRLLWAHLQDELRPLLWRFDLIADARCRAIATDDVAAAGLIVLATSEGDQLPGFINDWMQECLARKRAAPVAMLTLFGARDTWSVWTQDSQEICARRHGLSARVGLPPGPAATITVA